MNRSGTLIAAGLLVTAAILFAPRAGEDRLTSAPPQPADKPAFDPRPELVDLTPLLDQVPDDDLLETMPDEAWRKLVDFAEYEDRQGTRAEYEQISAWLRETTDHAARLRTDRGYRESWRIITNRRFHPFLSDREFVISIRPPWLVFVETGEGARECADRAAKYLVQLTDEVHRLVGKRFDLPWIVDSPYEAERVLTVTVFEDERVFHEHFRRTRNPVPPDIVSVYSNKAEGCFLFRKAKLADDTWCGRLLYPAAHQVFAVLTKVRMERDRPDKGELRWVGRGMQSNLHWFREGLVRHLSSNSVGPDGTVSFGRLDREGLAVWQQRRLDEKDEWPLATLLKIPDRRVMMRKGMEIGLHPMEAARLARLFGVQSALFFHFLWNHDNPEYRERLIEYLGKELHGKTGYKNWVRVWGEGKRDGAELAEEFEAWVADISKK